MSNRNVTSRIGNCQEPTALRLSSWGIHLLTGQLPESGVAARFYSRAERTPEAVAVSGIYGRAGRPTGGSVLPASL